MNDIYDGLPSREELLRALETRIERTTGSDGRELYRLRDREGDELRAKIEAATQTAAAETERRRDLQSRLDAANKERESYLVELEKLRAEAASPSDARAELRKYVERATASQAKIVALEAELKPLREEVQSHRERETRAKIEAQIDDAARKLRCRETALRDARRLAPMFRLNEAGIATTDDSRLVSEVLREEIERCPHWLEPSQGADASAGRIDAGRLDRDALFRQALESGDFAEAIKYAPRS
ncbi:MAG: hypothetical protein IJM30_04670 [Thermoguttaceae bacterium]|nr:hypothetical protein [Thermoguttaceae bacterium]